MSSSSSSSFDVKFISFQNTECDVSQVAYGGHVGRNDRKDSHYNLIQSYGWVDGFRSNAHQSIFNRIVRNQENTMLSKPLLNLYYVQYIHTTSYLPLPPPPAPRFHTIKDFRFQKICCSQYRLFLSIGFILLFPATSNRPNRFVYGSSQK